MDLNDFRLSLPSTVNSIVPDILSNPPRIYSKAESVYEIIMSCIGEFEAGLDEEHEVGMQLAAFGQSLLLAVEEIECGDKNTLIFYGFVNGQRSTLIQSVSQLNFLLTAVPKADPKKPARRIGFSTEESQE